MIEFAAQASQDDPGVLVLSGDFDLAVVDTFIDRARAALEGTENLEIDVSGVTFIDSTGLGALVRIREEAAESGKTVRLSHVPAQMRRILDLTGLSELFDDRTDE